MAKKVCKYKSATTCGHIESRLTPCPDCPFHKDEPMSGPPGAQGGAGPKGDIGLTGPTGSGGIRGEPGPQGTRGVMGLTGPPGTDGPRGVPGPKGEEGPKGAKGAEGTVDEEWLRKLEERLREYAKPQLLLGYGARAKHANLPDVTSSQHHAAFVQADAEALHVLRDEWLQNGFPNRTDSSISFADGDKTFTITPTGASFDYFIAGVKYTVSSADSVAISDTEGVWYIYYDGSTLTAAFNPNHAAVRDIYENKAPAAIVFWDADNGKSQLIEERHGLSMSPAMHIYLHETVGTRFDIGLALNTISADQDGSADSHAQFGVDAGEIFDEDIEHSLNAIGSTTGLQIWYRDTSGWTFATNAGFSMPTAGSGRLAYDNAGTLTEVTNGDFVLCHVFATSFTHANPVVAVGQAKYSTKKAAQAGAVTEITSILSIANISPELKPIATVIFQTKNTFTNAVKAIVVSTDEGDDYVDFRTDILNPAFSSAQAHGNLAGLLNDDHPQYQEEDEKGAANGYMGLDASQLGTDLPKLHAATHQNGGDDEVNVSGLSGELADNQPPKGHGIAAHTEHGNWKLLSTDGSGDEQELALTAGPSATAGYDYLRSTSTTGAPELKEVMRAVSITIEDPTASEDIAVCFFYQAVTIREVQAVVVGTSCTIDPYHNAQRSGGGAGGDVLDAATLINNTTTGQNLTSFTDATLPADSWLIFKSTAVVACTEINVTFRYTID